jgi:hypothetical protein
MVVDSEDRPSKVKLGPTIGISSRMQGSRIVETLLHELLHAIYDLNRLEAKENSREDFVSRGAVGLAMIMRDNPGLFEWMTGMIGAPPDAR